MTSSRISAIEKENTILFDESPHEIYLSSRKTEFVVVFLWQNMMAGFSAEGKESVPKS